LTVIAALDLGGTKILGGLYDAGGGELPDPASWRPVVRRRVPTRVDEGPAVIIRRMGALVHEMVREAGTPAPAAIGVASPGPLDRRSGIIIHAPNLFWHDVPLAEMLSEQTARPVVLDNDANLAALAEWAVRPDPDPLLYVTVSTGIGGGIISGGDIFHGFRDAAGEVGHITIVPEGPGAGPVQCHCGNRGCLETVASGSALERLARERLGPHRTARDVARLFAGGDEAAAGLVREVAGWLGTGLAAVAAVLDPEVVVVGGGMTSLGPGFLDLVRTEFAARLMPRSWSGAVARVEEAVLGEESGLAGAALLALRAARGRPQGRTHAEGSCWRRER